MWFMHEVLFPCSVLGISHKCSTPLCPPNTHYWLPSSLWGLSHMTKCVSGKQLGKKGYKISRFTSKLWGATTYGDFLAEGTGQAGLGQRNLSLLLLWKAHSFCVKTIRLLVLLTPLLGLCCFLFLSNEECQCFCVTCSLAMCRVLAAQRLLGHPVSLLSPGVRIDNCWYFGV